jgi:predicted nucleotide-binding protein
MFMQISNFRMNPNREDYQHFIDLAKSIKESSRVTGETIRDWISIVDQLREVNPILFPALTRTQFIRLQRDIVDDKNPNTMDQTKYDYVAKKSNELSDYIEKNTMATPQTSKELIESVIQNATEMKNQDYPQKDIVVNRAKMIIRQILGDNSQHLETINKIHFQSTIGIAGMDQTTYFENGRTRLIGTLKLAIEELALRRTIPISGVNESAKSNKVFIVHGRDNDLKLSIARTLEKFDLIPIILHEQANEGKTVIEKFEKHSDVGFAIILLSPDDVGGETDTEPGKFRPRARQNVILEMGYFIGKLGRPHVCVISREEWGIEQPSDIFGIVYEEFDKHGGWEIKLARELRASGYEIDMNKLS